MASDSDSEEQKQGTFKEEDMKNVTIRYSDFTKPMESKAIRYAVDATGRVKMDKDCATLIKSKIDADHDFSGGGIGAWQVIVGKSFAASLTYNTNFLMFFDLIKQRRTILVFKTQ
jgi:Dynein light chain type 1